MSDRKTFYLIDGHAQLFRAYYAPFRELTAPDGRPVKAVYVFTQLLLSLLAKNPDYLAVAFDVGDDSTFRKAEYDAYKANRDESPEDLAEQYLLLRLIIEKLGVAVFEKPGYEADDLIATIAKRLPDDVELRVVSKDKDLHQILNDRVGLYDPKDGTLLFGPDLRDAKGYDPEQAVEIQTLVGDPTDNVPGVKGIGVKTAAALIDRYGSADAVLAAAEEQTPARKKNLLAAREVLPVSRRLVTLIDEVPMRFELDACLRPTPDPAAVTPIFDDLGFRTFAEQLERGTANGTAADPTENPETGATPTAGGSSAGADRAGRGGAGRDGAGSGAQGAMFAAGDDRSGGGDADATDAAGGTVGAGAEPMRSGHRADADYRVVRTEAALHEVVAALSAASAFAVDTETTGLRPVDADLLGIALATRSGAAWYLPVQDEGAPARDAEPVLAAETVLTALAPALEDPDKVKVGQNLKYDLQVLWNAGARVDGPIFDTLIAAALLRPERRGNGLDALARDLLGLELIPTKELIGSGKKQISMREVPLERLAVYAAEDADATWRLYELLQGELAEAPDDLRALIEELEFPLVRVLARMEARGVHLDVTRLIESAERLSQRIAALREEIQELAGRPFNPDSPAQLSEVLFDDLGMRVVKRTKTGRSTDASVLETLAAESEHPLPRRVLAYRELTKLHGTYVAPLPGYVSPVDGRLHASFHQVGAATGRLSSSDPNIQNIPVRSETGREVRKAFRAGGPERRLLVADYSQVELRMLAHLSGDVEMRRAFDDGLDIHAFVAAQVYGVPLEEVDAERRRVAKTVNFGIVYGQGAFGLARTLGIAQSDAAAFIAAYKERYAGIDRFLAECVAFAQEHGYVRTILGRRRPVEEIRSRNRNLRALGERLAINTVVQGSAADLIKRAMLNLDRRLTGARELDAHMIVQVHDELIFDVPAGRADSVLEVVRHEMTHAMDLSVPLVVDAGVAETWGDAKG